MPSSARILAGLGCFSLLASASPLAQLHSRAPPTITGWDYTGCFTETTEVRTLNGASYFSDTMTVARCATFCTNGNFPVFGVEYGRECYCGASLGAESLPAPETECSFSCAGKASDSCGGSDRLNVYNKQVTETTPTTPSPTPLPTTYTLQGCFSDSTASRSLKGAVYYDDFVSQPRGQIFCIY